MPPPWFETPPAAAADIAACRAMLRCGSRSFHAAGFLLPRRVFEPAAALYAFCRQADDCIDVAGGSVESLQLRLDAAYAGTPRENCADRAFAAIVARHAIPRELPAALLEGFAWDAAGRRYEDLPALQAYAARVAGSVGAMMALLMDVRDPDLLAGACDLGMAMQFSNIARDVGEDARAGRLYLPLAWMRQEGLDPDAFLARPIFTPALGRVVARLLRHADALYQRGDAGIAGLPLACRPGIGAARLLYDAIGKAVLHAGGNSIGMRAVVPAGGKIVLLARALAGAVRAPACSRAPTSPAAQFLVDAACAPYRARRGPAPRGSLDERIGWLVELFARLGDGEQREA